MTNYHLANTDAQWFQDKYPGADMHLSDQTTVLVLHTTESMSWPTYEGGATAPTYTAKPNLQFGLLEWRAHFPDEKSARALQNLSGGVETNTLNVIQVELVGTCNPAYKTSWAGKKAGVDYVFWPDAPKSMLRGLARFVVDLHKRHGLALTAPVFLPYPASYGNSAVRMTGDQWRKFTGICGHQHVPENVHGDPGNIDIKTVLEMVDKILNPPVLRLVELNLHHDVGDVQGRVEKARNLKGSVYFTSEAYNIHGAIHDHFDGEYVVVEGEGGSKGHREVQLLVHKSIPITESGMLQMTKDLPDKGGVAHDRWIAWAKAEWRGRKIMFISWHANAAIQNRKTWLPLKGLKRVREYVKEIKALQEFCAAAQAEGFDVILAGDGNYRAVKGVHLWYFSPERLHRRLGLTTVAYGLDKVAFPATFDVADTFTTSAPGADHPWVIVDLEKAK